MFGPWSPSNTRLVILRRLKRNGSLAVAQDDEADFFAFEKFLDDHRERQSCERVIDFRAVLRDHDAFARGETIGLQDDRIAEAALGSRPARVRWFGKRAVGMPSFSMKRLEWILLPSSAAFCSGRADNRHSAGAELIDYSGDQRDFGADHGQIDRQIFG